jgi:hypothetical protein
MVLQGGTYVGSVGTRTAVALVESDVDAACMCRIQDIVSEAQRPKGGIS